MAAMFVRRCSSFAISKVRCYASATSSALNVLSRHTEDVTKKHEHLLQMRKDLDGVKWSTLTPVQQCVLETYPRVSHELDFMKELYEEFKLTSQCPLTIIPKRLLELGEEIARISQLVESLYPGCKILTEEQEFALDSKCDVVLSLNALTMLLEEIAWEIELDRSTNAKPSTVDFELRKKEPLEKHRYLLVSNGCEVYCLDLTRSKYQSLTDNPPLLPIIATLNLLEQNVGLFKWRSNACMVGGHKHPEALKEEDLDYSCRIHGLSLDETRISLEEFNMLKLKKPKIWPTVEEIRGDIHVIDCFPHELDPLHYRSWNGSHDVLDGGNDCLAEEVPTVGDFHILSYLVVDKTIYAVSTDGCLVFNSRRNTWHTVDSRSKLEEGELFKDVWDILNKFKVVSCIGGFMYGKDINPLYVVIALKENSDGVLCAVAYLVNSSGLILCKQPLVRFFDSLYRMFQGTIIKVEEDLSGKKKMMCSIVIGSPLECGEGNYVLINFCSVEELPDVADKVRAVVSKGSETWPVELEFAHVDVIDRHVCKTDAELLGGVDSKDWINLQACFM